MAKTNENILKKAREQGLARPSAGMTVPEGYFEDFAAEMAERLPFRPEVESPEAVAEAERPRTLWQKVRPYVYMAAMFAGVWCMLQMFASLSGTTSLQPMSENPILASALADDDFVMDYIYDDVNSWDIVDEMMEDGSIDDTGFEPVMMSDESTDYILPQ